MPIATSSRPAPERVPLNDSVSPPSIDEELVEPPRRRALGRAGRWGAGGTLGGLLIGIACCGALPFTAVLGLGAGLGILGGVSALVIGLVSAVGLTTLGRRAAQSPRGKCCATRPVDQSAAYPVDGSSAAATTDVPGS